MLRLKAEAGVSWGPGCTEQGALAKVTHMGCHGWSGEEVGLLAGLCPEISRKLGRRFTCVGSDRMGLCCVPLHRKCVDSKVTQG